MYYSFSSRTLFAFALLAFYLAVNSMTDKDHGQNQYDKMRYIHKQLPPMCHSHDRYERACCNNAVKQEECNSICFSPAIFQIQKSHYTKQISTDYKWVYKRKKSSIIPLASPSIKEHPASNAFSISTNFHRSRQLTPVASMIPYFRSF